MCISFLIVAWILSLFNFDIAVIAASRELFNIEITTASYYVIAFIIGLLYDITH